MFNNQEDGSTDLLLSLKNLRIPALRTDVTPWHGHLPLAFVIMAAVKPSIFVELGTHKGDSYCAFCQAAEASNLVIRCFAVDTWSGDEHAGHYSEDVYQRLKEYHDPLYGSFSTLLRCTFDQAIHYFEDNSIDLLHIDGLHTYDAVKSDFYKWLPKLSKRAVVLLHDLEVRERDFGVWQFWKELQNDYPTFNTSISHGLGIVAVGTEIPKGILPLFYNDELSGVMKHLFSYMGSLVMETDSIRVRNELFDNKDVKYPDGLSNSDITCDDSVYYCQFYYGDEKNEFHEDDSDKRIISIENNVGVVNEIFIIRSSCSSVRVDPLNCTSLIEDFRVYISTGRETEFREVDSSLLMFVGILVNNSEFMCIEKDPQIILQDMKFAPNDMIRIQFKVRSMNVSEVAIMASSWILQLNNKLMEKQKRLADLKDTNSYLSSCYEKEAEKVVQLTNELKTTKQKITITEFKLSRIEGQLIDMNIMKENLEQSLEKYRNTLDQLQKVQNELNTVLATKGWKILNVLRTLRNFAKQPYLTWRKVYASYKQLGIRTTIHRISDKISRTSTSLETTISYDWWQKSKENEFLNNNDIIVEEIISWNKKPLISVIMPTYNSKVIWLEEAVQSLLLQPYMNWELIISDDYSTSNETISKIEELGQSDDRIHVYLNQENRGISGNTNVGLENAKGDLITFLDHDDVLSPNALYEVVKAFNIEEFDILYSDEDKIGNNEYEDAFFKPDYSPDYLLSCNYFNHLTVYRKEIINRVGYLRSEFDGAQDYDLLLRATEISNKIVHIPHVLYHWRKVPGSTAESFDAKSYAHEAGKKAVQEALIRRGERGAVFDTGYPGHYRVNRELVSIPLVSILIPIKDKVDILKNCLDSIKKSTYKNIEILIIDNGSKELQTLNYLDSLAGDYRVIRYDIPFNYSRLNNWAAKEASGEYLLFLNNDIEVITPDWIEQMLQHAQRPEVGVVGAKLYYADERIQHAGVVLGIGGVAGHSHKYFNRYSNGYFSCLIDIRNYSAVTAACMLVSKEIFEKVNGFDEINLAVAFNDVDLCLRIGALGYYCVYTPYAELWHHESLSRGLDINYREVFYMQKLWWFKISNDPFYNVNLSLTYEDFRFDPKREKVNYMSFGEIEENILMTIRKAISNNDELNIRALEAINVLTQIFMARKDLQKAFYKNNGEIDLVGLLRWAVVNGVNEEGWNDIIRPYLNILKDILLIDT